MTRGIFYEKWIELGVFYSLEHENIFRFMSKSLSILIEMVHEKWFKITNLGSFKDKAGIDTD